MLTQDPNRNVDGGGRCEPIFVVASARSGSTLVRFLLDRHPNIACPPETNVAEACAKLRHVATALELESSKVRRERAGLPEARTVIDALLQPYLRSRGKRRWCDKSPGSVQYLRLLAEVWPEAQFVCLYRHCMDVVHSGLSASPWGLHAYGFGPYGAANPGNSVAALISYWIDCATATLRFEEAHPDRCVRLYYEELVTSPESRLREVFAFLHEEPTATIAERALEKGADYGSSDYKIWATDEIHTSSIGLGRALPLWMIPPPLLAAANDVLKRLGYVSIDVALSCTDSLDPLLKAHTPVRESSTDGSAATRSRDGHWLRLVALEGPLVFASALIELPSLELPVWASGCDASEPVSVIGQKAVFRRVGEGDLNVGEAFRSGELRVVCPRQGAEYWEPREIARELVRILREGPAWERPQS